MISTSKLGAQSGGPLQAYYKYVLNKLYKKLGLQQVLFKLCLFGSKPFKPRNRTAVQEGRLQHLRRVGRAADLRQLPLRGVDARAVCT